MKAASIPQNEIERLAALYEYDLLDTMNEKDYDDITKIAAEISCMPISLISIIDANRQWFKSKLGFKPQESHRDIAFCAHAILSPDEIFIVTDPSHDERFHDNPLVTGDPNIGFYAGVPLVSNNGHALGTLCVIDNKPNELSKEQEETLKALARQIVSYFEIRKITRQLAKQKAEMEQMNNDLKRFAYVVAHDIKSPYNSMAMSVMYLKDVYGSKMDKDGLMLLDMMESTSRTAISMVDGILEHTLKVNKTEIEKEKFIFKSLTDELRQLVNLPPEVELSFSNTDANLFTSRSMVLQILLNLVNNAIKYNDKEKGEVTVGLEEATQTYRFTVKDNGPGISKENQAKVFDLFTTLGVPDRYNKKGTGIGLSTVQRLVEKLDGKVEIESEPGNGCTFTITIRK